MTRKRNLLVLLAVASLGIAAFIAIEVAITPEPGVSLDNYDRLRAGMTVEQCEALLGPHQSETVGTPPGPLFGWMDRDRRVTVCLWINASEGVQDGTACLDNNQVRQGLISGSVFAVIRAVLHL